MTRKEVISDLCKLGLLIENKAGNACFSSTIQDRLQDYISRSIYKNGWFDSQQVSSALYGISTWLNETTLNDFTKEYTFQAFKPKLGLILAGNLPLVGFHDVMCGLLSGYRLDVKMSSEDQDLLPILLDALTELNISYPELIRLNPPKLVGFDAIIGTGSDSSLLHFKAYFKNIPHLLRGNRTSVAILTGNESPDELQALGKDIFSYFGRGCRNVTHLIVPQEYNFDNFFKALIPYQVVIQNKKYGNNYDYNRAVYLLSQKEILDNGFLLLMETKDFQPPLAMVYYHRYATPVEFQDYLKQHEQQIQCVVGKDFIPFGKAQIPSIDDYADGINTMAWLANPQN